ncbi:MAG: hypothetical protein P9X24_05465 [Candidatus Hatepunaea meridiana]|nr:hypothetical protein [Candidatus Hatepunaea meridiana]
MMRTKQSWLDKAIRFLISIFRYRRLNETPTWYKEPSIENMDMLSEEGPIQKRILRLSNKFDIRAILDFWKAIVYQEREVSPDDDAYVEQFLDDNISLQITPEERKGYLEYYRDLDAASLKVRSTCVIIKSRIKQEVRERLIVSLYRFAYSRGFKDDQMLDIQFYCQLLEISSKQVRFMDSDARKWWEKQGE